MKTTQLRASLLAVTMAAVPFAPPAHAGECGFADCWGAVAFNAQSGAFGYSHGYMSETEAAKAAQEGCRHGCPEVKTFANQCGAAAIGANGGYGWGFGLSGYHAENAALAHCSNYDFDCQVLVWSCSR